MLAFMVSPWLCHWPDTWPFSLDDLPANACLVGGSVRDRLLNRESSYLDLDFVLPEHALETARAIAHQHNAGFVVLDEARQIARVVFKSVTVDFAQQQGDTLEADLRRRDFTINAIAYSPHREVLIDPLQGETDLARHTLRMVSAQNLAEDPLRLMRAYRQAAQLGFTIASDTQAAIAQLAPKLSSVSMERIRSELDALLSISSAGHPKAAFPEVSMVDAQLVHHFRAICQYQLLQFCLPCFTLQSIAQISAIEDAMAQLQSVMPNYVQTLQSWTKAVPAGCYRSWLKAAKLSCLLSESVSAAQAQLAALKYSRSESQLVLTLLKVQPHLDVLKDGPLSRAQQFFLFKLAGDSFPAVSVLALAQGADMAEVQGLIEKFLDPVDAIAHAQPLITGTVLMKQLGIRPGPEVGRIMRAIEQAQATGDLVDADGAISFAKQLNSDG